MIPLTHVKMIPFTQREMSRAYRQAKEAAKVNVRTNAHRLLLFYAVECGLKVAYMRQQNISIFDAAIADQIRHNLNDLMAKKLIMGREFLLPFSIDMKPVNNPKNKNVQRRCSDGTLNQLWRYGGEAQSPADSELEDKLEKILAWVAKEINQ